MKSVIFFLLLAIASCSKDSVKQDPIAQLPPETQTGANTFGCYVNGNLLIPRSGSGTTSGADYAMILGPGYPNGNEYNEIYVNDFKSYRSGSMVIHIQSLEQLGIGNYVIDESNGQNSIDGLNHNYLHCRVFDNLTNSYKFYRSYNNSGVIKITRFDFVPFFKRIISGTFTCRLRNSANPAEEIEVTSGRFDINGFTLITANFP